MVKYVIFEKANGGNREYVYQIVRSGVYTCKDIGNAIEFYDEETVLMVKEHLYKTYTNRNTSIEFYVLSITTNYKEI